MSSTSPSWKLGLYDRLTRPIAHLRPIRQFRALQEEDESRMAPTPPVSNRIAGHLPKMRADRLSYVLETTRDHGDIVRLRFGWMTAHLVAHPDFVRHVLVENQKNYDKQTPGFEKLRFILGNGLVTSDGAFWKRQRRIAQPAFQKEKVNGFAPTMATCVDEMVEDWVRSQTSSGGRDMHEEMMRLTLRIAGLTLLSSDFTAEARAVGDAISELLKDVNQQIGSFFEIPKSIPTPRNRRVSKALGELDRLVNDTIADRARSGVSKNDLLQQLMDSRDEETGERMDPKQLRDEVLTAFTAGHETTANALSWSLAVASQHPAACDRLREEVRRIAPSGPVTAAQAQEMHYTKRFVSEVMRLYPPAWMMGRRALARDEIGGYPIPADSIVFVSPWMTHRNPRVFENPEGFDPDRFLPERISSLPKFAYFPFGGGPRICIGQGFAMLEAVILLAAILRRVSVSLLPGHTPRPMATVTLRPDSVMMRVRPIPG